MTHSESSEDRTVRPSQTMSVRFDVGPVTLAKAMAIDARDAYLDSYHGPDGDEDPRLTHHVNGMSRARAMRALRESLHAYGAFSWPDDIPDRAYRAALVRARDWYR